MLLQLDRPLVRAVYFSVQCPFSGTVKPLEPRCIGG